MGCTGSKYQTLSAESTAKSDDGPAAGTPESNGSRGSPNASDPAVGPPPWGVEQKAESPLPEFEPPIAEMPEDHLDLDMTSENLEEKFPPWKESDKYHPPNSWSKPSPGSVNAMPSNTPATSSSAVPRLSPEDALAAKAAQANTTFENTIIIFDWDDTLLCSSALHCCLPNQFSELEEIVETVLHSSMALGRTIIVTNAMESWIQETARRFMPRLMPTLERLLIVYARKNWERLWPGDTFAWKREAFRELLNDKLGSDLNLVVLGDSLSEIRAAEALAEFLGSAALVKTVKFKALPSPADLLGQLRTIHPELSRLVEERHSQTKELYQDAAPGGVLSSVGFQGAPNWQLLDAVPNEMFTPPPGVFAHQHLWSVVPPAPATQITI